MATDSRRPWIGRWFNILPAIAFALALADAIVGQWVRALLFLVIALALTYLAIKRRGQRPGRHVRSG